VLKGSWTTCCNASQTLDLSAEGGMRVTVSCNSAVRLFTIDAVVCNGSTSCADATAAVSSGYAEARRQVQATN